MPKHVRVRLENGTEKTVTEVVAQRYGYKPLRKPTHGRDGRMLPPKPRVPLGGAASAATSTDAEADASTDESQED